MRSTLIGLSATVLASMALAADVCNGHAELCDQLYSGVTFIGAHNSYAVGEGLGDNQFKNVTDQLTDGIRTLQVQTHSNDNDINVCHTSCAIQNGGTLTSYLQQVTSWVSANPNDVVTLVIVNIDNLPATSFAQTFSSAGLEQYMYSPTAGSLTINEWPTLGSLIDSGKRVLAFMDNQADFSQVPYLIDEFSNMFEDSYDVTDQSFGCGLNRSSGNAASQMMLINHFLDTVNNLAGTQFFLPDRSRLNETNAESGYGSIGAHVDNCNMLWGRKPNHILLDYYDSNGLAPFNFAASLNNVAAPTNSITPHTPEVSPSATGSLVASGSSSGSAATVSTSRLNGGGRASGQVSTGSMVMAGGIIGGVIMGVMGVLS